MRLSKRTGRSRPGVNALAAVGAGAVLFSAGRFLLNFFGPTTPYAMGEDPGCELDSDRFVRFLSLVTDGTVREARMTRLQNGQEFYPAQLEAIRGAKRSVNLETYEFLEGEVASEFLAAMEERARAGVAVRLTVDALGSFATRTSYFNGLRKAGGHMRWYHPLRWNTWQNANNRTHRKLLVVDGEVGFIGGAGIADQWLRPTAKDPQWRDSMFRVTGEGVEGLLSTFSENWLEAAGEILSGPQQFDFRVEPGGTKSFVVIGTPHGGNTQSRILFQALIKSAKKSLRITTPYFLPDRSARAALAEAVEKRGVEVKILTAGPHIDHPAVRTLSRNSSHRILRAGAEIFEYQPAMIHAKTMVVDDKWCVVGSTNFDHRSFALNDEVSMAVLDEGLVATLRADFEADLAQSKPLTLEILQNRGLLGLEGALLEPLKWES